MLDKKSTKKPMEHLKKHLKLTFKAEFDLKDEAYVQVLKQIKMHPNLKREKRGWIFLSILACCYSPSLNLYYSILNYLLFEIKHNIDQTIVTRANYVFSKLVSSSNKKRREIPSTSEIINIEVFYK